MLRDKYDNLPLPWVLENEQLVFAGSLLLIILGALVFLGYLILVEKKLSRAPLHLVAVVVIVTGLVGTGLTGLREQKDLEGTSVYKYNTAVNNLLSERAGEKYGVAFAQRITPETLAEAKTRILSEGGQSKVLIGFSKDGDLMLMDEGSTELERR